jgi:hypothetical protein
VPLSQFSNRCGADIETAFAANFRGCDAGQPGVLGYSEFGNCGDLASFAWVYGAPGDTCSAFSGGRRSLGGRNRIHRPGPPRNWPGLDLVHHAPAG